ncbi:MAG TPA: hypothetical protein DCQ34_09600 [Chitinophagaceae bacterium]|nr:hypothetical protein [Chitinophagaceae bacterium]
MHIKYWYLALALTLAMMILLLENGKTLVSAYTPLGIVNLEMARSKSSVRNILNIWSTPNGHNENVDNIKVARQNIYWDFVFIFCYTAFFILSVWHVKSWFHKRSFLASVSPLVISFCIITGVLDVLENIGMLVSLHRYIQTWVIYSTFICALLKWMLVGLILLYLGSALTMKLCLKKIN